jgi:hypothetical protein
MRKLLSSIIFGTALLTTFLAICPMPNGMAQPKMNSKPQFKKIAYQSTAKKSTNLQMCEADSFAVLYFRKHKLKPIKTQNP